MTKTEFTWTPFYEEMAGKLLEYKERRQDLLDIIYGLPTDKTNYLGHGERFTNIDPFSVMAMFNRSPLNDASRKKYTEYFKDRLDIEADIPEDFNGIPVMFYNQAYFLLPDRTADIEVLWKLFESIVNGSDYEDNLTKALSIKNIGGPITFGMFWARPKVFISLDKNNREYLDRHGIEVPEKYDGNDYSLLLKKIKEKQETGEIEEKEFAEISYNAWIEANEKITFSSVEQLVDTYLEYYKTHGGLAGTDELYKWEIVESQKGKPRLDNEDNWQYDLKAIRFGNLLYGPQKTAFVHLANYKPTEYRKAFEVLYDESKDLQSRIDSFIKTSKDLWTSIKANFKGNTSALCDERLISLFLTLHNPQSFTFYKVDVYDNLCQLTGEQKVKGKQKLKHFYDLLNVKVLPVVKAKGELQKLVEAELSKSGHTPNLLLLAQTILWFALQCKNGTVKIDESKKEETMNNEKITKYIQLLKQKKNIILQGAPGTGKTYTTAEIAVAMCDKEFNNFEDHGKVMKRYDELQKEHRIEFCTFHQSMDYEDFVEGLRPQVVKDDSGKNVVTYDVEPGIFKRICENAQKNLTQDYVLIIDELNRGNVSKIFGELITLLEADMRTGEKNAEHPITVKLPYSKEPFSVPDNLYIIGTMNTTDRSTGTIDYAVRRRFAFVTLEAKKEIIKDDEAQKLFDQVQKFIKERRADENFDMSDLMVGHSYFMTSNGEDIKLKMEYEVIPLIKEYIKDGILTTKKGEDEEYFKHWKNGETYQKPDTSKAAETE